MTLFNQYQRKDNTMKALICELCGSNDIVKQNGLFVCQYCGTKYSIEDAKAMMIVNTGNNSDSIDELLDRAKKFLDMKEFSRARKLYDKVVEEAPEDPRGWWGLYVGATCNFSNPFDSSHKNYLENAVRLSGDHGRAYYKYIDNVLYEFKAYLGNNSFNHSLFNSVTDVFGSFVTNFKNLDFVSQGLMNAKKANAYKIKDVCSILGCKRLHNINSFELINGYSIIFNYYDTDYDNKYYLLHAITNASMCINGNFDSIIEHCRKKGLFG